MTTEDKRFSTRLQEALLVPALAVGAGLLVGAVFILMAGRNPLTAYGALLYAVAGEPRMFGETLVSVTPLILTGLASALAFRCGLFNIGAEGQYLLAQVAAVWAGYSLSLPGWLHPGVAMLSGMAAAAVWAAIPGLLKAYRNVHEVINTIMLNYIALALCNYLLHAFMKDPGGVSGAATPPVRPTAQLTQGLIAGSRLHWGLGVALLAALAVWVFLFKTPYGYEIRAVGFAPRAAEYGGISMRRSIVLAMALSGALAGLAGAIQSLALNHKFYETASFIGLGFDGIAVALLGRTHPVGVILAALLFGALDRGGPLMQGIAGVPKATVLVIQGAVIFFVAADGMWRFAVRRKARTEVKAA